MVRISGVTCEYRSEPVGLGVTRPRISYRLDSDEYGVAQKTYRLCVSSSREKLLAGVFDLYDSQEVESENTVNIRYNGSKLSQRKRCYYTVCSSLTDGRKVESDVHTFETGLLYSGSFRARFIRYSVPTKKEMRPGTYDEGLPSPYLRKSFVIEAGKGIKKARAYATALGVYTLKVNGLPASDDVLSPGWCVFDRMQPYQTYDLTGLLRPGENVLGAVLGDGWYTGSIGLFGREFYGGYPLSFFCQVEIDFVDGTSQFIFSDKTWKASEGPIRYSDFFSGESYDAQRQLGAWDCPGYDDSKWDSVNDSWYGASPARGEMKAQIGPPMSIRDLLMPVSVTRAGNDTYRYDLGQNMVGWQRFRMRGMQRGKPVTFVFAEALAGDGTLYRENLRRAKNTDRYFCSGAPEETFEPSFTYRGFRFVDVSGLGYIPELADMTGCVVHSSFAQTGEFSCSDPLVNRLYLNALWSQKGNMLDVPTDCPQRDERWGCMTDATVFARSACFNMDMSRFYAKFTNDMMFSQRESGEFAGLVPGMTALGVFCEPHEILEGEHWTGSPGLDGGIIIPYLVYLFYKDTDIIGRNYCNFERYMSFLSESTDDCILGGDGCGDPATILIPGMGMRPHTAGGGDLMHQGDPTPDKVLNTAYYAWIAGMMAEMSRAIGRIDRMTHYESLKTRIVRAFNDKLVDPTTGFVYGDSQTGYAVALNLGILEGEVARKACRRLAQKISERGEKLSTGCIGNGHLLPALCDNGFRDVAYSVLLQQGYPSWLYSVVRGATTIWERWDGFTDEAGFSKWSHDRSGPINSLNHYFLGCVEEWFYMYMGGIVPDPLHPGWRRFLLKPFPDRRVSQARVKFDSVCGVIESEWKYDGDHIIFRFIVPANTSAKICVPSAPHAAVEVVTGEKWLRYSGYHDERHTFEAGSGKYEIRVTSDLSTSAVSP
jgi:alpha-L-rhamnosidase